MKNLVYLLIGIFFGIVLYKSEAVSWYRIYEMFMFQSIHMYGIIGMAVGLGIILVKVIKKSKMKSIFGEKITVQPKPKGFSRYILGGAIFGLGWGLAGACPGPIYILVGAGVWSMVIVLISAVIGTFLYGMIKKHLIH